MRKKLILQILSLGVTILLMTSIVYAWFLGEINSSRNITIISESLPETVMNQVKVDYYMGKDLELDGILDTWYENGAVVDRNNRTFNSELLGIYNKILTNLQFEELLPGKVISYRIIIKNTSNYNLRLSSYFQDFSLSELKVLFNLCGIEINKYSISNFENKLIKDYTTGDATPIQPSIPLFNLYDLKNQESFLKDIDLASNELLDFKFNIKALSYNDAYMYYMDYEKTIYKLAKFNLLDSFIDLYNKKYRNENEALTIALDSFVECFNNPTKVVVDQKIDSLLTAINNSGLSLEDLNLLDFCLFLKIVRNYNVEDLKTEFLNNLLIFSDFSYKGELKIEKTIIKVEFLT